MRKQVLRPEPNEPLADSWSRVATFVSRRESLLDRWLTQTFQVSLVEFKALATLRASPDHELRVNALASCVALSESSATRLISRLEAKGLLRREFCEEDRRGIYAALTPTGAERVRLLEAGYEQRVRESLKTFVISMAAPEVDRLVDSLSAVGAALRDQRRPAS